MVIFHSYVNVYQRDTPLTTETAFRHSHRPPIGVFTIAVLCKLILAPGKIRCSEATTVASSPTKLVVKRQKIEEPRWVVARKHKETRTLQFLCLQKMQQQN